MDMFSSDSDQNNNKVDIIFKLQNYLAYIRNQIPI